MKGYMILIALLIMPLAINAQDFDTKVKVASVGLVINNAIRII